MQRSALFLIATVLFNLSQAANSEPWLSTRFAQNCAGCHSPGRYNTKIINRRCSLSCQGCHVNPNGGGMRSFYGKWNENYWLRSFRSDFIKNKRNFARLSNQPNASLGPVKFGKSTKKNRKGIGAKKLSVPDTGLRMNSVSGHPMYDTDFYRDGREYEEVSDKMWVANVLDPDPYREKDRTTVDAGGDFRFQISNYEISKDGKVIVPAKQKSFFMAADMGVRWRPIHRNLHIVSETRMRGAPTDGRTFEEDLFDLKPRALYAMVDDIAYNSYVMTGYYRPLFGNYVPDHTALAQTLQSFAISGSTKAYDVLFNTTTIGTAPNVPYLNVHYIGKQVDGTDDNFDRTSGFLINSGLRFVSFGASVNYYFWKTENDQAEKSIAVEMQAIHGAATLGPVIASLEAVSLNRDDDTDSFRQGGVYTLDTQTKIWRENYFLLSYAKSNTTSQLLPGSTVQTKIGLRSFVIQGLDISMSIDDQKEVSSYDSSDSETIVKGYSGQVHVFF